MWISVAMVKAVERTFTRWSFTFLEHFLASHDYLHCFYFLIVACIYFFIVLLHLFSAVCLTLSSDCSDTVSDPGVCVADIKAQLYLYLVLRRWQSSALPKGKNTFLAQTPKCELEHTHAHVFPKLCHFRLVIRMAANSFVTQYRIK